MVRDLLRCMPKTAAIRELHLMMDELMGCHRVVTVEPEFVW